MCFITRVGGVLCVLQRSRHKWGGEGRQGKRSRVTLAFLQPRPLHRLGSSCLVGPVNTPLLQHERCLALSAGCCSGSMFAKSWHHSQFFKGLIMHFPPTLAPDSGEDISFSSGGCFPLTAQISKMQMHLETPAHFPARRHWAVPMLCINKRLIHSFGLLSR